MNYAHDTRDRRAAEKLCDSGIYELARSLARPVARGLIPVEHAVATIWATVYREARIGGLDGEPDQIAVIAEHILCLHLHGEETRRDTTVGTIERIIAPRIAIGEAPNAVRAEAHDVNGSAGFPLSEAEVEAAAMKVAWRVMRTRRAG